MITRKQFLATAGSTLATPAFSLQSSKPSRPKNVLVLLSDQHHPRAMGFTGDKRVRTPNIDALAAAGTSFHSAYCSNPVCGPSRASIMTGLYTHHHGVVKNDIPWRTDLPTIGHHFTRAGYLSATIGKAHFADAQTHGFDYKLDFNEWHQYLGPKSHLYAEELARPDGGCGFPQVFSLWEKGDPWKAARRPNAILLQQTGHPSAMDEPDHFDSWVARESVRFLKDHAGKQPLFLISSFLKPHAPFAPPPRFIDPHWKDTMTLPATYGNVDLDNVPKHIRDRITNADPALHDPELARQRLAMYDGCINHMDHCVGQVMEGLRAAGIADDTIVIYTSDHGEMRGEHGLWGKFVFYDPSVTVPFIVRAPGVTKAGTVCAAPVSQVALAPTLLDLCGLPVPAGFDEPGLVPFLHDTNRKQERPVYSEFALGGKAEKYMLRQGDWKYSHYMGDTPELYNLRDDPDEMKNLARSAAHQATAKRLEEQLLQWHAR